MGGGEGGNQYSIDMPQFGIIMLLFITHLYIISIARWAASDTGALGVTIRGGGARGGHAVTMLLMPTWPPNKASGGQTVTTGFNHAPTPISPLSHHRHIVYNVESVIY